MGGPTLAVYLVATATGEAAGPGLHLVGRVLGAEGGRAGALSASPEATTTEIAEAYLAAARLAVKRPEQHDIDPNAWRFLSGPENYLLPLVVQGFHLGCSRCR